MPNQLRINFFGAPARGKSNLAAWTYSTMRLLHFNAELVQEWIKHWAYNRVPVQYFDQIYVFGKQHHLEYDLLKAGVKNIITDSPTWLSVFYAPPDLKRPLAELNRLYDQQYLSLNFLVLKDHDADYEREGRYQDADGAQQLEDKMLEFMYETVGADNFHTVFFSEREKITKFVLDNAVK